MFCYCDAVIEDYLRPSDLIGLDWIGKHTDLSRYLRQLYRKIKLQQERLKQFKLPSLKYRCLYGDMIDVCKLVHSYYDSDAAVKLNFNSLSRTRGNMYRLRKFTCHYYFKKYLFCSRVVNIRNSLPNGLVIACSVNNFKNRLDKHWINQEVFFIITRS